MKKILINGLVLKNKNSGVQYSIEHLVRALGNIDLKDTKIEVLLSKEYHGKLPENNNLRLNYIDLNASNRLNRIRFEQFLLPQYLKKNEFKIYHSPAYILPYLHSTTSIVTIHDLITLDFPKLCQNETALYFSLFLSKTIKDAEKIITVSSKVKQDILHRFPNTDEKKIEVIYPGIAPRYFQVQDSNMLKNVRLAHNLPEKFFLFVGNLEPKKNISAIIKAYNHLRENHIIEHKLVLVGECAWKYSAIIQLRNQSPFHKDILLLGYVPEEDLPAIYVLADIFLFPSIYEGFGIPVIEAMACGCPVILSNTGALPETSGGHCLQINPYNITAIVNAILFLLNNEFLRTEMIHKGLQWAKKFTWEISAQKTFNLYRSVSRG